MMMCGLVQLLFVILLFIQVDSNANKQSTPIHVSRRSISQLDPIKPLSTHKPRNKVDRVTREYVKKQIKRELSERGRSAGLCSTMCSGMKVSSSISLNDNDRGGIMECMLRKPRSVSATDLLYEA